jgi:hypothetical protein
MADFNEAQPDLQSIKPGVKEALSQPDSRKFDVCTSNAIIHETLSLQTKEDGRVSYIERTMTAEECDTLCQVIDSTDQLSFWNTQGRQNEKARQFRDADTIEVNLASLAETLWERISPVFDKTPVVIRHDDTEHVRTY